MSSYCRDFRHLSISRLTRMNEEQRRRGKTHPTDHRHHDPRVIPLLHMRPARVQTGQASSVSSCALHMFWNSRPARGLTGAQVRSESGIWLLWTCGKIRGLEKLRSRATALAVPAPFRTPRATDFHVLHVLHTPSLSLFGPQLHSSHVHSGRLEGTTSCGEEDSPMDPTECAS